MPTNESSLFKPRLLKQIERVLLAEKNHKRNWVSLYDVANLFKTRCDEYSKVIVDYFLRFKSILKAQFGEDIPLQFYFDYHENVLKFSIVFNDIREDINISKVMGNSYISESVAPQCKEALEVLAPELANLYDEFMDFYFFHTEKSSFIKSNDLNFIVSLDWDHATIFPEYDKLDFISCSWSSSYVENIHYYYDYSYDSSVIQSALQGKEDEFFKSIFVKISDCPEWTQPLLHEFRQNQLTEEQKLEEEKNPEMQAENKSPLTRKLFPFFNRRK